MMIKRSVAILLLFNVATVLIIACGGTAPPGSTQTSIPTSTIGTSPFGNTTTSTPGSSNEVHMDYSNFIPSSITISKGSSLTLVDDVAVFHIVTNGTWDGTTPKPSKEAGAPTVNTQFQSSDTHQVGPFTTAGTYHLYCTVHPGMNLTVIVK